MRNLIFACVAVLGVAGCGDNNNNNKPTPVKDLSVKASPDLTQPLNGCNGLLMCYINCNTSADANCFNDCDAGASQMALDLLNAFGQCIDDNCFGMGAAALNSDSGKPYCDNASMDPTSDPVCNDCYNRILGNGGACRASQTACTNNKP
jgi:hypothetical protein